MKISVPTRLEVLAGCEEAMHHAFEASAFSALQVPSRFAEHEGKGGVRAYSHAWGHPSGGEGRCALIRSARVEILNLMIFPSVRDRVPIFASEIIVMGGKVNVAVVDWQMPEGPWSLQEVDRRGLKALHDRWTQGLTHGGALPKWALEHFTPYCVYVRPVGAEETPGVEEAFRAYLEEWFGRCAIRMEERCHQQPGRDGLHRYLNHHVEHTPGRPFLSKVFGPEWAESYFRQFMYAPLRRLEPFEELSVSGAG